MNFNRNVEDKRYDFVWDIAMQFTSGDGSTDAPDVSHTMSSKAKH